jgi:N-acylneuraminate cytidylyltransferase/CMP-N,N'-diacetyllegionaminic acid synthase
LRELLGKPLIAHSIEQAKASGLFRAVAVSSDSEQILDVARRFGADVLVRRPAEMATDVAAKLPAILHCVDTAEKQIGKRFPVFVDLDATSPLRLVDDIAGAVALLETTQAPNVITAAPARRSPYFNLIEVDDKGRVVVSKNLAKAITRRQDSPKCYDMNASIYAWRRDIFFENPAVFYDDTKLYVMPEDRSIDIDSEVDFDFVELMMSRRSSIQPVSGSEMSRSTLTSTPVPERE